MTLNVGEENVLFEEYENPAIDATAGILKEQEGVLLKYRKRAKRKR